MNAHKIRGPVASILGIADLLADERNAHLSKELLQHLHTSSHNLDDIIKEVNRHLEDETGIVGIDGTDEQK